MLVACGEASSPEETALEFWAEAVQRDYRAAAPYSNAHGAADVETFLGDFSPSSSPAIGEALTSEDRALVETVFLVGEAREPLSFNTHLLRVGEEWRVDLARRGLRAHLSAVPAHWNQCRRPIPLQG